MDARYVKAVTVLPEQGQLCGRVLRPFSLRHRVVLESVDSPFLKETSKAEFSARDVIIAVKVLSETRIDKMVKWTLRDHVEEFIMRHSRRRLARKVGALIGIINKSNSYPKLWQKEKDGDKYPKVPWVLSVICSLNRNGCSLEEAWTMPEGDAIWMALCHSIYNGAKVDILSTQEEDEQAKFHERIAEFKKSMQMKEVSNG